MVRGLEILTKQVEILADFVELANRRWCRTVQTFLEEDSVMKARKSESELQRVRLKRQESARPADRHQHRQPVFPGEINSPPSPPRATALGHYIEPIKQGVAIEDPDPQR